jgi:hypothetical protein
MSRAGADTRAIEPAETRQPPKAAATFARPHSVISRQPIAAAAK